MVVFGPGLGRVLTVEFDGPPADRITPLDRGEIEASLRRVSGTDVTVTSLVTGTRWTDTTRQAATYRRGRVLLAGDAAHVHPPFAGQGLNLGFQDAVNLGWKLAATIAGRAADGLLDTYHDERGPVAAAALDNTRAQVALMRPDLYELLRAPGGLLLDASPDGSATRLAAGRAGQVTAVPGPENPLIRPDGIVAWGGPTIDGLDQALGQWFGPAH